MKRCIVNLGYCIGAWLVFLTNVSAGVPVDGFLLTVRSQTKDVVNIHDTAPGKLMRYDLVDGKVKTATALHDVDEVTGICLSPFGDRIAFTKADGMIALMGINGGEIKDLIRFTGTETPSKNALATSLQWPAGEGGKWIYYLDGRAGGANNSLRRVHVDTAADELVVRFNRSANGRFALSLDATRHSGRFVKRTDNSILAIYDLSKGDGDLYACPRFPGCGESISPDGTLFTANNRTHSAVDLVDMTGQRRFGFRVGDWEAPDADGARGRTDWAWQHCRWSVNAMNWIATTQGPLRPGSTIEVTHADAVLYDWVNQKQINVTQNPTGTFDRAGAFWQTGTKEEFLGYFTGKAPFTVTIDDPRVPADAAWVLGDKSPNATGRTMSHTYPKEGTYAVTATHGDRVFRGQVTVQKRLPPSALAHFINETCVLFEFNEPVQAIKPNVRMTNGLKVRDAKLDENGRRLLVRLSDPLRKTTTIRLEGIQDLAQVPNALPDTPIPVTVPAWPSNRTGLLFLWEHAKSMNALVDEQKKSVRELRVSRDEGSAGVDRYGRMRLDGGRLGTGFFSKATAQSHFRDAVAAGAISLEATIQPANLTQTGPDFPTRIVNCTGRHDGDWEFMLGQHTDRLLFSIRTTDNMLSLDGKRVQKAPFGRAPVHEVATLTDTNPHHVIVSYVPGRLIVYLDGQKSFETAEVTGSLEAWGSGELCFGDNQSGGRHHWLGKIEGVAIYHRVIEQDEAAKNHAAMMAHISSRKVLPQIEVEAKLLAVSRIPELREIAPYRDALVINEFQVTKVLKTSSDWKFNDPIEAGRTIRVAQWGMVDGLKTQLQAAKPGDSMVLVLEVFTGHPEKVEEMEISHSLTENFDIPLLYEPRP